MKLPSPRLQKESCSSNFFRDVYSPPTKQPTTRRKCLSSWTLSLSPGRATLYCLDTQAAAVCQSPRDKTNLSLLILDIPQGLGRAEASSWDLPRLSDIPSLMHSTAEPTSSGPLPFPSPFPFVFLTVDLSCRGQDKVPASDLQVWEKQLLRILGVRGRHGVCKGLVLFCFLACVC